MKAREGESRHPVQWPTLSDTKAEETLETVHLFATTLYYEIAPLLESIRSNAELLHEAAEAGALESKKEGRKISPSRRLSYIAQEAVMARQLLEQVQHLSTLRTKTVHGITMLDLAETQRRRQM